MGIPSTADELRRELAEALDREESGPSPVRVETEPLETHVRRAAELFPAAKPASSPAG